MSYPIKQSTTTSPLLFLMVDDTDHVTGKTGLSPTVTISKNGATFASPAGAVTELANGWYKVAGNATDSATLGPLVLHATGTAADPSDVMFNVVANFEADTYARLGTPAGADVSADIAAVKLDTAEIGTAGAGLTNIGTIATVTNLTNLPAITANWLTAAGIAASALDGKGDWNTTTPPTAVANADAVWDELRSGHVIAGSFGENTGDAAMRGTDGANTATPLTAAGIRTAVGLAAANMDTQFTASATAIGFSTHAATDIVSGGAITTLSGAVVNVDTVDTCTTNTDMRGTDGALTDKAGFSLSTAGILAIWHQLMSAIATAGSIGKQIKDNLDTTVSSRNATTPPTAAENRTEMDANSTQFVAIVADTNELQTDWANGGRLDLILDARASQTTMDTANTNVADIQARIPSTLIGGRMDSDVEAINGNTTAADNLQASALGIVSSTAKTGTLSTTQMTTNLTETTDDHYLGRIVVFTSGVLAGQATDITAYTGASMLITMTALTEAPSNGDSFVIV